MKKNKELLSVIVPCYNEEQSLPYFYEKITNIAKHMDYIDFEFIFINDGSIDNTLQILKRKAKTDNRVKYISFSRNFGKEAAIFAGLKEVKGNYVTLLDADLQDPPSLLPTMYKLIKEKGYDCVCTRRTTRKNEPPIRSFFARLFYKIINKISKVEMVDGARDYRLMTRKMVDSIVSMQEYNRFSKGLFSFVGYKTKYIEYENVERIAGTTKWSFWSLFTYAIEGIVAFTTLPLVLSIILGVIFLIVSFVFFVIILIKNVIIGSYMSQWVLLTCIIIFVSGIQLLCIGIVGEYLSKVYLEVKKRPIYIVAETNVEK